MWSFNILQLFFLPPLHGIFIYVQFNLILWFFKEKNCFWKFLYIELIYEQQVIWNLKVNQKNKKQKQSTTRNIPVFYCCAVDYHKVRSLKQYPFWAHNSVGERFSTVWLGSLLGVSQGWNKVLARLCITWLQGRACFQDYSACWQKSVPLLVGLRSLIFVGLWLAKGQLSVLKSCS